MPENIISRTEPLPTRHRWRTIGAIAATLAVGTFAIWAWWSSGGGIDRQKLAASPQYVGRQSCASCHQEQMKGFEGSHHDRAMDLATKETVLADFNDVQLEHQGVSARMFRDGDRFLVETEGPDGKPGVFEVRYVFGVEPLQQYMVETLPAATSSSSDPRPGAGQVQVLRWSWDTHRAKWFHLDPPDVHDRIDPEDPLHWTGVAQRWNVMCAECHSTNLTKGFDVATASYLTQYSEIDVSCESCHGPASRHLQLVDHWWPRKDRQFGWGLAPLKQSSLDQIQACAPCHARREMIAEGFKAGDLYDDYFLEAFLTEGTYFADGQVQDEVYIHGSFLQSKMFHKGIRCTDCHDPHTARLKHSGNEVCTSCHQHPAAKYDSVAHHFHPIGSTGASCVECHMPPTTYMDVDPRHDHSFRIPRPDLSLKLGTPNACSRCHFDDKRWTRPDRPHLRQYGDWVAEAARGDQEAKELLRQIDQWSEDAAAKWYGTERKTPEHFGVALHAARTGSEESLQLVPKWMAKQGPESPAIVRATLLHEFARFYPRQAALLGREAAKDPSPLVRRAATAALGTIPDPGTRVVAQKPLLADPVRSVRVEAAAQIATAGPDQVRAVRSPEWDRAWQELLDRHHANRDRAGAHLGLGLLAEQIGKPQQAIEHYRDALRLEPQATGPRSNLAVLYDVMADSVSGERLTPEDEKLKESWRQQATKMREEELPLLLRDADLLPKEPSLQYRSGLALYMADRNEEALERIRRAVDLSPEEAQYRTTLVLLLQKMKKFTDAIDALRPLLDRQPNDPGLSQLLRQLQQQAQDPAPTPPIAP